MRKRKRRGRRTARDRHRRIHRSIHPWVTQKSPCLFCETSPCTRLNGTKTAVRSSGCSSTTRPTSLNATTPQLPSPGHGAVSSSRSPSASLARRASPTCACSALDSNTPCSPWSRTSSPWRRTSSSFGSSSVLNGNFWMMRTTTSTRPPTRPRAGGRHSSGSRGPLDPMALVHIKLAFCAAAPATNGATTRCAAPTAAPQVISILSPHSVRSAAPWSLKTSSFSYTTPVPQPFGVPTRSQWTATNMDANMAATSSIATARSSQ